MSNFNRRKFLKTSIIGGVAATCIRPSSLFANTPAVQNAVSPGVALTTGSNRADMVSRALEPFTDEIIRSTGNRRIVLKPNFVSTTTPLCATHADTMEGLLEFFKSIGKLQNVIIAESAGGGPTPEGYDNYGFPAVSKKYGVKLYDLDEMPSQLIYVFDEKDFRPHPVRVSSLILDPDTYVVSVARMKTHDRSVVTLSLKNIVFGAPVKDPGYAWGPQSRKGTRSDKPTVHGSGFRGINYNLYALADQLSPDLAIIDGFQGMEGNGPIDGTPVDHRVCVASTDWFAADRVAVELMGLDFEKVGYLNFVANTRHRETDINKIKVLGESVHDHIKTYKLSDNIDDQLQWMKPVS